MEKEWIPTAEKLPRVGQKVVFIALGKHVCIGERYKEGWWNGVDDFEQEEVAHWFPIPKKPKAEAPQ